MCTSSITSASYPGNEEGVRGNMEQSHILEGHCCKRALENEEPHKTTAHILCPFVGQGCAEIWLRFLFVNSSFAKEPWKLKSPAKIRLIF